MTATGERELRRAVQDTLGSLQPPPAPIEAIIRQGKRSRLRRTGAATGGLALAGILAVAALTAQGGAAPPAGPVASSPAPVAAGGVIAHGVVNGQAWRLAAQNIADPGYACVPAIVLNGTAADPVYPDPATGGVVALGPGTGFGFVQLPADVSGIVVNGQTNVPAVTVTACGLRYRVAGFAYPLDRPLQVTVPHRPADWPTGFTMPAVSAQPPSAATTPETAGLWYNTGSVSGPSATGTVAWGSLPDGQEWVIKVQFGPGGDCYTIEAMSSGNNEMGQCVPVSTPDGLETIVALPISFPAAGEVGVTGYAVQVSPDTGALTATLSDGSAEQAAFCLVDGRTYAAFLVRSPLKLSRLTWTDGRGQVIATTTTQLPQFGFVQFQP